MPVIRADTSSWPRRQLLPPSFRPKQKEKEKKESESGPTKTVFPLEREGQDRDRGGRKEGRKEPAPQAQAGSRRVVSGGRRPVCPPLLSARPPAAPPSAHPSKSSPCYQSISRGSGLPTRFLGPKSVAPVSPRSFVGAMRD